MHTESTSQCRFSFKLLKRLRFRISFSFIVAGIKSNAFIYYSGKSLNKLYEYELVKNEKSWGLVEFLVLIF